MTDQPITQEETLKPTLGEEIRELYSRVAKLNDTVSALLSPAWGSEVGIIPSDHPLYVGEQPVTEEQGAPVDYAAYSRTLAEAFGRTLERHGYEVHELVLHSLADTALRAQAADRQRAEAAETALDRYREWLAAEHAKAAAADRARECPVDLRVSPHNGIAAGLRIALHGADHLLVGHTPPGPAGTEATEADE